MTDGTSQDSIYSLFSTDKALEQDGIEIRYGKYGTFRVARAGGANKKFGKTLEAKARPYRRLIDQNILDESVGNDIMADTFAETVLLGWEGVRDRDGNLLPFSVEAAKKLLRDIPDLFTFLRDEAMKFSNYRAESIEDDAKN